jgi:hypothetical protein
MKLPLLERPPRSKTTFRALPYDKTTRTQAWCHQQLAVAQGLSASPTHHLVDLVTWNKYFIPGSEHLPLLKKNFRIEWGHLVRMSADNLSVSAPKALQWLRDPGEALLGAWPLRGFQPCLNSWSPRPTARNTELPQRRGPLRPPRWPMPSRCTASGRLGQPARSYPWPGKAAALGLGWHNPAAVVGSIGGANLLATQTVQRAMMGDTVAQKTIQSLISQHSESKRHLATV